MILDLVEKTPDFLIGTVLAGGLWLGFNYAVLAERAMGRVVEADVVPHCVADLEATEGRIASAMAPLSQMGSHPLFGSMVQGIEQQFRLSGVQRQAMCACGAERVSRAARFDYAIHTASFRAIEPEAVSNLRGDAIALVQREACGVLPWGK